MDSPQEQILQELFTLDPALQAEEPLVRALVAEMVAARPAALPDAALRALVRARLLAELETKKATVPRTNMLPWWLVYAAPVGVAVVVMLLVLPTYTLAPTPPVSAPVPARYESLPTADVIQDSGAEIPLQKTGDPARMTESAPVTKESAVRLFRNEATDMVVVLPQPVGMTVRVEAAFFTTPAFVVVREAATGLLLGGSELKLPGETEAFTIRLSVATRGGVPYEVVVFRDDGDGVLNPVLDQEVTMAPVVFR